MNYSGQSATSPVNILGGPKFQAVPITVAAPTSGTVVKAGTPLTAAGASTTGSGAAGILLYDVNTARNPNAAIVVSGIIDTKKAQAHSGVTYASALRTALPAITFRENIGIEEDGSGGNG